MPTAILQNRWNALAVVVLLTTHLAAQSDRGTLTGTVTDPSGAVISGAVVAVSNLETGSRSETITTPTGNYSVPQLPAGAYELIVEVNGFKRHTQRGILLQVAQTARVDVVLQVGSTADTVNVTADAPLLKTESAEQSHNISTERMNALPLNFGVRGPGSLRNPFTFVQILPGASIQGRNDIRINGTPNTTFGIRLEGQDTSRPLDPGNSDMVAPSVEAVQEISVQTSNFAAEYGQVAGGLFNFTTKSGSNAVHGSAYEYLVNEAFHAGRPFTDNGNGEHIRPKDRKQDYGASLGGPVYIPKVYDGRNRTFFFFNIEKYVNRGNISGSFATVPTEAMRRGDFSSVLRSNVVGTDPLGRPILENAIYDPSTLREVNGLRVTDPFPGNIIPTARFDPVAAKIQALIPLPTRPGVVNNFEQVGSTVRKNEITSVKIDHTLNEKSKFSVYHHYYRAKFGNNGVDGLPEPITAKRLGLARTHTARVNYDYSVTPTLLLHLGAGSLHQYVPDIAVPGVIEFDSAAQLGLRGAVGLGFPRITGLNHALGGLSLGIGPTNSNLYYSDKPTAVISATYVKNNHTYKAGAEWRIDTFTNRNLNGTYGTFGFSAEQTRLPSTQGQNLGGASIGFPYASFLLGRANSASVSNVQDPQYRRQAWGLFVQDTWKVTRRLTLDYGLRWDYQPVMRELHDRLSAFDPNVRNPAAGGLPGATSYEGYGPGRCDCRFAKTYPFAIGPRLGVAYQITPGTVLRAGWGITYGSGPNFNYIGTTLGTGYNTREFGTPSFGDPAVVLASGLQYDPAELYVADFNPGIRPTPGQINNPSNWVDPNGGRPSRITQWSIGVQRELGTNLVVEANYVGNRGAWIQANSLIDLNALSPERIRSFGLDINNADDRTLLTSRMDSALARTRGFSTPPYAGYPLSNTVAQSLRPYPQFGSVGTRWSPLGSTWYDSLQLKATKRYSHGLEFTAAFTWQKELTRGSDSQDGGGGNINDVFNRENQKYLSSQSQPLVFVTSVNYEIPRVGPNALLRHVLGGWTVGGILRYASGMPILVPGSNNQLASLLFRGTRQNRVAGEPLFLQDLNCGCIDPNKEFVLNPRAWSDAGPGQWGVSAAYYNDYRYARRPDEQLSIGRTFRLKERLSFHVRGEFFNAFNRIFLANPTVGNPQQTRNVDANGVPISGFGRINALDSPSPRTGQLVARFQF